MEKRKSMAAVSFAAGALGVLAVLCATGPAAVSLAAQPVQLAQDARPLVSGERVRVKKLVRDMESAMDTLNRGGVTPFQDPAYVEKWEGTAARFRQALDRFPQADDPDVQAAAAKLRELENMLAFGKGESAKQQAQMGDPQQILANIEKALGAAPVPQWLPAPFSDAEVAAWVRAAGTAKATAQKALAELQRIAPTAHLPLNPGTVQSGAPYDRHDLDRLMRWSSGNVAGVDESVQETANRLGTRFKAQDERLAYFRGLDPDNENDRMNAFLQESSEARIYGRLDDELALARSVVSYQKALGKQPTPATVARVEEIAALRQAYAAHRLEALGDSRLPEPKSTDAARVAIAGEILAEPSYEFGQHGPVVLTTPDIVEREETVSRAEIKDVDVSLSGTITMSGTQTSWHYKWREFKFATPIRDADSGDWYIWWITAKNFSSGWERTPIGVWISGGATKGSLILEKNF
ncbi:MAG: hypothetical protein WD270_10970 [Acetobacterales bacterium]